MLDHQHFLPLNATKLIILLASAMFRWEGKKLTLDIDSDGDLDAFRGGSQVIDRDGISFGK